MPCLLKTLRAHWPEYLMEAAGLGMFMISAGAFTLLLYHPASPVVTAVPQELFRRALIGLAMGATAIALIYSPWGKQSGAHLNPSVTLTFLTLGKIAPTDALFYVIAQFLGGAAGIGVLALFTRHDLSHPDVNFAVTVPGAYGAGLALAAEVGISFLLMSVVLRATSSTKTARYTGVLAGCCVAMFILVEAPVSGMSMNPARTWASAIASHTWNSWWIYFVAPPAGMLLAASMHQRLRRESGCAKLHHDNSKRCIFCEYRAGRSSSAQSGQTEVAAPHFTAS